MPRLQKILICVIIKIIMIKCESCPVECGAVRSERAGYCGVKGLNIAKYYLHPFEEPCISYKNGSGTVFFTGCNLKCVFCQNFSLSRAERGKDITPSELADIFKELEDMGAENISLVTPSHVIDYIIEAFDIYRPKIPVVFNGGGYEKIETLKKIDPYIDIYLPDLKFMSPVISKRYTGKEDYFYYAEKAVKFMAEKPVKMTDGGKMLSGIIIRHLIMPMCAEDSVAIMRWIKNNMPEDIHISLMSQYTPVAVNEKYPELNRRITAREYKRVLDEVYSLGLKNVYLQDKSSAEEKYIPEWDF